MKFGSVCSGIEAASVAWEPLGWKAAWFSEIEPFPSAVLKHHYPDTPNVGDMTALPDRIKSGEVQAPDLFCGGTPCQAFSVAGLRKSLDDARGNLSLTFCEIANAIDNVRRARGEPAAIVFWENVPGVLNTKDNAFGCFLAGLAGEELPLLPPGGKWTNAGCVFGTQRAVAWRVLDAQYFGVAQRRRRVFVVASAREGFDPAEVLFEWEGLRRDSAPSREAGKAVARSAAFSAGNSSNARSIGYIEEGAPPLRAGASGTNQVPTCITQPCPVEIGPSGGRFTDLNPTLDTRAKDGPIRNQLAGAVMQPYPIANTLTARMHKGLNSTLDEWQTPVIAWDEELNATIEQVGTLLRGGDGGRHDGVLAPISFHPTQDPISSAEVCHSIGANENATAAVAFDTYNQDLNQHVTHALRDGNSEGTPALLHAMQVRRLTPVECERLQGFPDNYTAIPWRGKDVDNCPDGPRYKALGNSWAVPVVRWIGNRIQTEIKCKPKK